MKNSIDLFEENYISFTDLYDTFKFSEYYQTLTKVEKRSYTKERITKTFRDECHKRIDEIKSYLPKRITGYILKI